MELVELFNKVNWVDVIILILLIRICYVSLNLGVSRQLLPLIIILFTLFAPLLLYREIANFFIETYSFSTSVSEFNTYVLLVGAFILIYVIIISIVNYFVFRNEGSAKSFIERIGGLALGSIRACLIIGIFSISLILAPVRFIEKSLINSYSGMFFVRTNTSIYNYLVKLIIRKDQSLRQINIEDLLAKKDKYLFSLPKFERKERDFFKDIMN